MLAPLTNISNNTRPSKSLFSFRGSPEGIKSLASSLQKSPSVEKFEKIQKENAQKSLEQLEELMKTKLNWHEEDQVVSGSDIDDIKSHHPNVQEHQKAEWKLGLNKEVAFTKTPGGYFLQYPGLLPKESAKLSDEYLLNLVQDSGFTKVTQEESLRDKWRKILANGDPPRYVGLAKGGLQIKLGKDNQGRHIMLSVDKPSELRTKEGVNPFKPVKFTDKEINDRKGKARVGLDLGEEYKDYYLEVLPTVDFITYLNITPGFAPRLVKGRKDPNDWKKK